MAFFVDENGGITLIQGDSGTLTVNDLPTDKSYTVYFAIKDKKRNTIGSEMSLVSNAQSAVSFFISADLTNLLTVPLSKESEEYYYGVKICATVNDVTSEETLIIGESDISDMNTITVYPKRVEGVVND